MDWSRFKASETLLGIETTSKALWSPQELRFKASETLLGIETEFCGYLYKDLPSASKPLKPF